MARTKFKQRPKGIQVSVIRHSRSVEIARKYNFSSKINVNKIRPIRSFSKKSFIPKHHTTYELVEEYRNRAIVHIKMDPHKWVKQSVEKHEMELLEAKKLDNRKSEMNMEENVGSKKIKRMNVIKASHKKSQEQMINNSWTTPTTDDVDIKLTQNDFLSKNKIQQNTESQNRIYNGFDDNSNSSFQHLLRKSSNYQISRLHTNFSNKKDAWSRTIESIPYDEFRRVREKDEEKKTEQIWQKYSRCGCCPCSPFCAMISLFTILLILTAFAALLVALSGMNKTTTTTTTTTTITTTTTTTTTTITTTTTTTSTTTSVYCGQSCLNQSWIDSSNSLAFWPFDGSYINTISGYNATPSANPPTFVTGYLGQAASFNASAEQAMYTSFIPLNNVSFTVEAWIQPTGYPNPSDLSIVGLCQSSTLNDCLHLNIRSGNLYFGFYADDARGATNISLDQWIHVAFVFDATALTQTIYLNGFQDAKRNTNGFLLVTSGNFTIGTNEFVSIPYNYFEGYIDQLSISQRAQSSCEILERATLAAEFKFDTTSPYIDSGPNSVPTNYSDTSIITGYQNQAISFTGSLSSYFQAWGFTSLGVSNQPFSITLWIQPQILSGTLVHLSTSSLGSGSTCFPLLGFASNGAIVAQVLTDNSTIVTAIGPILPISSSWNLIAQTWSSTDGLKLYVNDILVSSVSASSFLASGTTPNYLTLSNCLSGCDVCSNGSVSEPGPFTGAIDDWRIYNRELTSIDVCTLYYTV